MKADASQGLEPGQFLSSNDVVSALLIHAVTKARGIAPDVLVKTGYAADGRTRLSPNLPKGYWGNANFYGLAVAPASQLLDDSNFAEVSKLFRRTTESVTDQYLREALAWIEAQANVSHIAPSFKCFFQSDLAMSNWSSFGMYSTDFGSGAPLFAGVPKATFDGLVILTSSQEEDGGIDALVGLMSHHMAAVDANPLLRKYVPKSY